MYPEHDDFRFSGGNDSNDQGGSAKQYDDEEKICVDCGMTFTFRERDRTFCQENGWTPFKRCKTCRDKKRRGKQS